MANKNYLDTSEVPKLSGDAQTDVKKLQNYICNLAGQVGYEISALREQMAQLRASQSKEG